MIEDDGVNILSVTNLQGRVVSHQGITLEPSARARRVGFKETSRIAKKM